MWFSIDFNLKMGKKMWSFFFKIKKGYLVQRPQLQTDVLVHYARDLLVLVSSLLLEYMFSF